MKIGVFDSGLGGLTVVTAIKKLFSGSKLYYIADTAYAPYGEKTASQILKRSIDITKYLIKTYECDALIVACNTATSAAIKELREEFPKLIVVGTEPGIKPALLCTKSFCVGVLATPATLKSDKYQLLVNQLSSNACVVLHEQACAGLVQQIEKGETQSPKTFKMLEKWLLPMKEKGVDTIVLGCTHYPLVQESIKKIMGKEIVLIQTGDAIASRLKNLSKQSVDKELKAQKLEISLFHTGDINITMVKTILKNQNIISRKCNI